MLDASLALAQSLGEHAQHQHANLPETGKDNQLVQDDAAPGATKEKDHQTHLKEAIENLERGSNTDKEGKSGSGKQAGRQGIVAVTAPDGIAMTTAGSMTMAAGANLDQIALRDTNQTTGRRWIHNATESISLFVSGAKAKIKDTFKIIAAKGNIQMQAQDGEIEATAQKDVTITSVNGRVVIQAPNEILLAAGGGYIRIGANIEVHNPGKQSQKAAGFALSGPDRMNASHPAFPKNMPTQPLMFNMDHAPQGLGSGWAGMPYKLFADGALVKEGVLENNAQLRIDHPVLTSKYKLELANGLVYEVPVATDYTNHKQGDPANQGFHRHAPGKAPDTGATSPLMSAREAYFQALNGQNETDSE